MVRRTRKTRSLSAASTKQIDSAIFLKSIQNLRLNTIYKFSTKYCPKLVQSPRKRDSWQVGFKNFSYKILIEFTVLGH